MNVQSIKDVIQKAADSTVTYVNFESTEFERDSTLTTIDTSIEDIHHGVEDNKATIMTQRKYLKDNGFDFKSEEGQLIKKLIDTMNLYQNEVEWRCIMIDLLQTYMYKYYEALEGAKGISQSSELIDKQQEYITSMFENMKTMFDSQSKDNFEQRKMEFGMLLQRFEFLSDRIKVNDLIINKALDLFGDNAIAIKDLAEDIKTKYKAEQVYTCSVCWQNFPTKEKLIEHGKMHIAQNKDQDIADVNNIQTVPVQHDNGNGNGNGNGKNKVKPKAVTPTVPIADDSPDDDVLDSIDDDVKSKPFKSQFADEIDNTDDKVKANHFKELGKELEKQYKYKYQRVMHLIKQGKYSDTDIMSIIGVGNRDIYKIRKRMEKEGNK